MEKLQSVISVVMVTIPIGFGLIFFGAQQSDWRMSGLLGAIGFGLLLLSAWEYRRTQRKIDEEERKRAEEEKGRHNELVSAIESLAHEIKVDREERSK